MNPAGIVCPGFRRCWSEYSLTAKYTGSVVSTSFDDDPVKVYLRVLSDIPPLTEDEEIELTRHVLASDEQAESAGKTLVEANLAMVVSVAESYPCGTMH